MLAASKYAFISSGRSVFALELLDLRGDAVISGVAGDQTLLDGSLKGAVEHEVDAADCGAA